MAPSRVEIGKNPEGGCFHLTGCWVLSGCCTKGDLLTSQLCPSGDHFFLSQRRDVAFSSPAASQSILILINWCPPGNGITDNIQPRAHMHALHKAFDSNWACLGAQLLLWSMRMMPPCAAARRVPHSKRLNSLARHTSMFFHLWSYCSSTVYFLVHYFSMLTHTFFFLSFRTKSSLNSPAPNLEPTPTPTQKSW